MRYYGLLLLLCCQSLFAGDAPLDVETRTLTLAGKPVTVSLPRGYILEFLAPADKPRLLSFGSDGELLFGSRADRVYRARPPYREVETLLDIDGYPHSVAQRDGELLIARTHGLYRAAYQPGQARIDPDSVQLLAALPGGAGHNSRSVRIGPDKRVYLSLGLSGNCSNQYLGEPYLFNARRGGVLVLDERGAQPRWRSYASGLRNPVGYDWQPQSGELYASNNGPDHWGFDLPPEVFAHLLPGSFHGMPWFQFDGTQIRRDHCISEAPPRPVDEVSIPAATFPARNAPMGVAFVPKGALAPAFESDAVVALRGSWGTQPSGGAFGDPASRRPPKLVLVRFKDGVAQRVDDLVSGFQLADGSRWARPVGVAFGPDGALYFSSDSGLEGIYRLRRATP